MNYYMIVYYSEGKQYFSLAKKSPKPTYVEILAELEKLTGMTIEQMRVADITEEQYKEYQQGIIENIGLPLMSNTDGIPTKKTTN
jgi:hypothetical protein